MDEDPKEDESKHRDSPGKWLEKVPGGPMLAFIVIMALIAAALWFVMR